MSEHWRGDSGSSGTSLAETRLNCATFHVMGTRFCEEHMLLFAELLFCESSASGVLHT